MAETYEIYLDESGDFEKFSRDEHRDKQRNPIRLIGGVLVSPELKSREKEHAVGLSSIREKYFPDKKKVTHIHLSDEELSREDKAALREDMVRYFNEKMPQARIVFIYDLEELVEDTQPPGAWIYRNMLLNLLKTLIFYHPHFGEDDRLDVKLAKRRYPYPEAMDKDLASQGYLKIKDGDGKTWFTAVTGAELKTIMDLEGKSLRFYSDRKASYKIRPYAQWDNPFMTMADTVCNKLFHLFIPFDREGLRSFQANLEKTFGQDRVFFYCRSNYDFPVNALESYYQSKFGEFLSKVLGREDLNNDLLLRPAVEKAWSNLIKTGNQQEYLNILLLAHQFLMDKSFHMLPEVEKIISEIKSRLENISNASIPGWDKILYLFNDVALRFHNHHGNVKEAINHRDAGQEVFKSFGQKDVQMVRSHQEFLNRASVADTNEFAFERAIAWLEPVRESEEKITNIMNSYGIVKNEILGKIYGSLAQNYAFLRNHDQALKCFKKAAEHLGWDNPVQISYRAHFYLDVGDYPQHFSEICRLYKNEVFKGFAPLIRDCLNKLPQSPYDFYLHLLLKGILATPDGRSQQSSLTSFVFENIEQKMKDFKDRHPWELIFITLGRLLQQIGQTEKALACWWSAANFTGNPKNLTLVMIGHSARAWEALAFCEQGNLTEAREALILLMECFQTLKTTDGAIGIFNPNKKPDGDGQIRSGWFDEVGQGFLEEFDNADLLILKSLAEKFISRFTFNYW